MVALELSPVHGFISISSRQLLLRNSAVSSSMPPRAISASLEDRESELSPTEAIKRAIEMTKKYGATSYRARLAWDVVERIEHDQVPRKSDAGVYEDDDEVTLEMPMDSLANDATDILKIEENAQDLKALIYHEICNIKDLRHKASEIKQMCRAKVDTQCKSHRCLTGVLFPIDSVTT